MKIYLITLLCLYSIFSSCSKETSQQGNGINNKPPVAKAGADQAITADSVLLDGSASYDSDGTIADWGWTKISGPSALFISPVNVVKPVVKNIATGVYLFELTIKDNQDAVAKDTVQIDVNIPNRPPVAKAGADKIITFPGNTTILNGNSSTDPDNNITNYSWTKILGPSSIIANANAVQTEVTDLIGGIYQFELKVTDAGSLFGKDTIQITVVPEPFCNVGTRQLIYAQLIPIGSLGKERFRMGVASAGNKIIFAGGVDRSGSESSFVDIYDISTNNWTTAAISLARENITAVANGNKIFFAGGGYWYGDYHSKVDIYDVVTNNWSATSLSEPKTLVAAAAVGNKVMFAGGYKTSGDEYPNNIITTVDIYDLSTSSWSTAQLSEARGGITATTINNKVYFAGGWTGSTNSTKIDIYDNASNSWSTNSLNITTGVTSASNAAGKIYWSGTGCNVEARNTTTGTSILESLSRPDVEYSLIKDGKIIFIRSGSAKIDIYDIVSNIWSIGVLPQPIPIQASIIAVNNKIYVAGGIPVNSNLISIAVYRLEF